MSGISSSVYTAFFDGAVAAGGSINVYQSGTTTPVICYANGSLTTPISNPIQLDNNGQANFYVSGSVNLRIDSYTGPVVGGMVTGSFIETVDPVYPVSGVSSSNSGTVVYQGTNLTLSTTNLQNNIIATAAINIALPLSTGFTNSFQCQLNAQGGAITLTCTSPDKIQQGSAGASYTIAQGSSGELWTDAAGNWGLNFLNAANSGQSIPQGRLTLTTNVPVLTTDVTAVSSIFYTPYIGNTLPIYSGTTFVNQTFSQLTLTINSTNHPASQVFDVYALMSGGVLTLAAMYWGSNTSRSTTLGGKTGTGNATITQKNGLWVNNAAISASDAFNNNTGLAIPQFQGTYLGSFYTTGSGQTGVNIKPAATANGSGNVVGLFNAYNRVGLKSISRDNTSSYTYATNAWRPMNASNNNRITWLDGLQQISVESYLQQEGGGASIWMIGVDLDSNSATPNIVASARLQAGQPISQTIEESFAPQLGLHFLQAMEIVSLGTTTFNDPGNCQALTLRTEY